MKIALTVASCLLALVACKDKEPAPATTTASPATPPANVTTTASFTAPTSVGVGELVLFKNTSQNAVSYLWYLGGGQMSTDTSPSYRYSYPGSYTVTLAAFD